PYKPHIFDKDCITIGLTFDGRTQRQFEEDFLKPHDQLWVDWPVFIQKLMEHTTGRGIPCPRLIPDIVASKEEIDYAALRMAVNVLLFTACTYDVTIVVEGEMVMTLELRHKEGPF